MEGALHYAPDTDASQRGFRCTFDGECIGGCTRAFAQIVTASRVSLHALMMPV